MDQFPKDEVLSRAIVLKGELEVAAAKQRELLRQENEQREAEQRLSDERAAQLIELLMSHEIPTVNVIAQKNNLDEKMIIGEGWIIKDQEMGHDSESIRESVKSEALVLLPDGITYECRIGEDGEANTYTSPWKNGVVGCRLFGNDKGLDILAMAAIKHKLV